MGDNSTAYKLMMVALRASELTAWVDINASRRALLLWMIAARVPFEPDDIDVMNHRLNGGHWFPPELDDLLTAACESRNKSAIESVSAFLQRPVWRWEPERRDDVRSKVLHVGATIWLDNEPHRITSFGKGGLTLIACSYEYAPGKPTRIKTRRTLTFDEVAAMRKARVDAAKAAKAARKAAQAANDAGEVRDE